MARSTRIAAQKTRDGDLGIAMSEHSTDSPVIQMDVLEKLHAIRPDKVDWIFEQTEKEAEYRRKNDGRVNIFVFIERLLGQIFGLVIGLSGIAGSVYLGVHDHEVLAGTIATATIATLAVSFIKGRNSKR
ncbi:hypothetical protein [Gilliamella apicola]|uniref:hypothetical protein n=1 Tax=Gilliamella apicola TaxID=1196095 RepID=UPI0009FC75F9|nr:hypothetical protein [Gilliamella apicola]ORF44378.1 hypothetical protein B5800_11890 [Gilliamella apicola]ORF47650.1 hypothetical protein B5799_11825 [Gilliamella apicola]ORF49122.1 hypothetical protein B5803_10645 [Gilliamella apicola]ORF52603.1 hypothetical protein B5798_11350 [Gilliamella apicola]ORF53760.1 hypothetical protein B5802_08670 [Gilliamella apicola]